METEDNQRNQKVVSKKAPCIYSLALGICVEVTSEGYPHVL